MKYMSISLLAFSVLAFGCKNKDCEDTAVDCTSGEAEEAPQGSCNAPSISTCWEVNEADNELWCTAFSNTYGIDTVYSESPCAAAPVTCDLQGFGDYTYPAVAYMESESQCTTGGGTVRE